METSLLHLNISNVDDCAHVGGILSCLLNRPLIGRLSLVTYINSFHKVLRSTSHSWTPLTDENKRKHAANHRKLYRFEVGEWYRRNPHETYVGGRDVLSRG